MTNKIVSIIFIIAVMIVLSSFVSFGATNNYTYDNLHRLTRVERPNGVVTVYRYDELGNRTLKVTTTGPIPYYCDNDQDNYINSSIDGTCNGYGCEPANCQTTPGNDCNDSDLVINPDTRWYEDADNDGFGNREWSYQQCSPPSGDYILIGNDYNDNDPNIYGIPVKVTGTSPSYYLTLQEAYNAAGDGATIQVQAVTFNESLSVNLVKSVTISGGYNGAYTIQSGKTTVQGNTSVADGKITFEGLKLQ